MKTIAQFKKAMVISSRWDFKLLVKIDRKWQTTKEIVSGECVRTSTNKFTLSADGTETTIDFPTKETFKSTGSDSVEIVPIKYKKFKAIISKSN